VHHGFIAWLGTRGWSFERYDDTTFFLVPLSYFHSNDSEAHA